jgi:tetratricopeptide (TPR) repeat protein
MSKEVGDLYCINGEYELAYEVYTKLLNDPVESQFNNFELLSNRLVTLIKMGKYNKALPDAKKCIKMKPDSSKLWGRLGAILYGLKDYNKALTAYEKANELENAEIYNVMIQMISIKITNSTIDFSGITKNLMEKMMDAKFLNSSLTRILSFRENIADGLKDDEILSLVKDLTKSLNFVNNS